MTDTITQAEVDEAIAAAQRRPGPPVHLEVHGDEEWVTIGDGEPRRVVPGDRKECAVDGHDWGVVERLGVGPTALLCCRCGDSHQVVVPGQNRPFDPTNDPTEPGGRP